ncbi:MAG: glycosyltransferase [Nitrospirota bacterium]|nr:glycosyltransferase [Nitrospirota bacterium]
MSLPSLSIVIPTYNSSKTLPLCLESIAGQDYPKEKIEFIIADGGSTDSTLEIAQKYTDKIYLNPLKTGEAGKAVGVKRSKGEIIALIDSDNILPSKDWLFRMKNFEKVLSKEGDVARPLYVIKGRNPL